MCGCPGQVPVSKSARVCRWPVAWLMMKSGSRNDLDDENHGDEPVDGGAERRPPPCAGNVVAALLPEVLEAVACVAQNQEPGRSGDACGGKQESLDGCLVEPPEGERRRGVDGAECQSPQNRYTYRLARLRGGRGCGYGGHGRCLLAAAAGRSARSR